MLFFVSFLSFSKWTHLLLGLPKYHCNSASLETQPCSTGNYVRRAIFNSAEFYYKWVSHKLSQLHQLPCRQGEESHHWSSSFQLWASSFLRSRPGEEKLVARIPSPSTTTITTLYLQITRSIRFTTNSHVHLTLDRKKWCIALVMIIILLCINFVASTFNLCSQIAQGFTVYECTNPPGSHYIT